MVLIDVLDETTNCLRGKDEGKFLEERQLLRQLGKVLDFNQIYDVYIGKGIYINSDNKESKKDINNRQLMNDYIWENIQRCLYDIIPDKDKAVDFKKTFEKENLQNEQNRIANLQNDLIDYFIESLKNKHFDDDLDDITMSPTEEFKQLLIKPGDVLLTNPDPDMNFKLKGSNDYFEIKEAEFKNIISSFSAK